MRSQAGISSQQSNIETIIKWFSRAFANTAASCWLLFAAWKLFSGCHNAPDRKDTAKGCPRIYPEWSLAFCHAGRLSNRRIRRLGTGGAVLAIMMGAADSSTFGRSLTAVP